MADGLWRRFPIYPAASSICRILAAEHGGVIFDKGIVSPRIAQVRVGLLLVLLRLRNILWRIGSSHLHPRRQKPTKGTPGESTSTLAALLISHQASSY